VSAIEPLRLYVSGVIEPHGCVEPGYGKLHVGIYVPAIQAEMDRKQQPRSVSHLSPPGKGGALIGGNKDQDNNRGSGSGRKGGSGHRGVEKSGGLQGPAGGKGPTDEKLAIEVRWHEQFQSQSSET